MQRLMRAAIGTNNIDNCSRVCHSPTSLRAAQVVRALAARPARSRDFDHADATILIGANPTEGHPVVGARIKQATLRGMKLVTIDPRRIELADYGVLHLEPAPGHQRRRDARHRPRASTATASPTPTSSTPRTNGYETLRRAAAAVHARGRRGDLRRPRRRHRARPPTSTARPRTPASSWGLGVTEHKYGSEVVQLICNIALMTGNVGRARRRAAAAARPEQRPGLLRHGRAAGHLHRLPLASATRTVAQLVRGARGASTSRARRATRSRRCSTPRSPAT